MKRVTTAVAVVAALAAGALAGTAVAATATLNVSFSGRAIVTQSGDAGAIRVTGKGSGAPIGKGATITAKGVGYDGDPCAVFLGTGTITAADGSKLNFAAAKDSKVCKSGDDARNAVRAKMTVKGGTKRFAKARGTLTVTGNYNRAAGTYTVKFTGRLTY
jgi:hypothetical protein